MESVRSRPRAFEALAETVVNPSICEVLKPALRARFTCSAVAAILSWPLVILDIFARIVAPSCPEDAAKVLKPDIVWLARAASASALKAALRAKVVAAAPA
jgi:hypothetical protein